MEKEILKMCQDHRSETGSPRVPDHLLKEYDDKDFFCLESKGLLTVHKTDFNNPLRPYILHAIEITENGILLLEEDNKGKLYKLSQRWGERKDGGQFVWNIVLTLISAMLLYLYRTRGVEISNLYDVIDQLKND